jgi:S-adenosylmethionine synthetase
MGRESEIKNVSFTNNGQKITKEIETFTWEKLDSIEQVKNAFNL